MPLASGKHGQSSKLNFVGLIHLRHLSADSSQSSASARHLLRLNFQSRRL
jgi:hypothetical protein